jgi:ArsR family transcriptional regulator, virulence genes transcriptional regulator
MGRRLDPLLLRRCGAALRTLAHPERLRLVESLEAGPLTVGELTDALGRPQATVSQHLMRLRAHGLVRAERQGREVRYAIAQAGCLSVLNCIRTHFAKPAGAR